MPAVSVVIPAYNEEAALKGVVVGIRDALERAGIEHEIVIVVDGAEDRTADVARGVADRVVEHPQNRGYGRSLKTGILAASHDRIVITDADGTYPADRLPDLIRASDRFDMVVGCRSGRFYQGGVVKRIGRLVFRKLSEFSVGHAIPDINSGMRVFRKSQVVPFFPVISAGFSFTTTSTLAYLHHELCVHYVPIEYFKRSGSSKVRHVRDSLRALQIVVEAILRCNPIKMFLLLAAPFVIAALICAARAAVQSDGCQWFLVAAVFASASGMILSVGFATVALAPPKVPVERPRPNVEGRVESKGVP
ncbi:MAG: glycosyltransferase family 2 protein [Planctomycetes bacterium]|nr:glycosyltransferase family 2 protein [Planctomycetota bacterium]